MKSVRHDKRIACAVPKKLHDKIVGHLKKLRRKDAQANLSDAVRDLILRGFGEPAALK